MKRRIALAAAAAAAAVAIPLSTATAAHASAWYLAGVYPSYSQCVAAGQAGVIQWGPLFNCTPGGVYDGQQYYNLMVH